MDAGCRDNRWTASLCTWPPGCSPLVLPPSQEVGRASASLSFVGCSKLKAHYRETHSPSRACKIYGQGLSNNTHIHTVINSGRATLLSTTHTVGLHWGASALTAATILADAAVTPPSPKWPNKCIERDVKSYYIQTSNIPLCQLQIFRQYILYSTDAYCACWLWKLCITLVQRVTYSNRI